MNIEMEAQSQVLVARVRDARIDANAAADLKAKLIERVDQGSHRIVLDLTAVQFVDSTGLGAMLSVLKRLPPAGGLALAGCQGPVAELVKLTRLDRVFRMFPTVSEAAASFPAG